MDTSHAALRELEEEARQVKLATRRLASASTAQKNDALSHMARALIANQDAILAANTRDLAQAREDQKDAAFLDRLTLSRERIAAMASAIEEVIALPDPVGELDHGWLRPNGLQVSKRRIPLGAIGIIYEARPNVTSDAAALCIKSGNGVLLKGGSNAYHSNLAIFQALQQGMSQSSLDPRAQHALGFVRTTDREAVRHMLTLSQSLDLIIPRGGHALISFVTEHARIPVIKHDRGVCHIVVEGSAHQEDAEAIVLNAKTQRPGVCNALETLLVLQNATATHLPALLRGLTHAGVKLHLCPTSLAIAHDTLDEDRHALLHAATPDTYGTEYLAMELAIRVVPDLDEAIAHIEAHGSDHSEALLSQDWHLIQRFQREVNSSVVLINASTRFSDGNQLGLGAEIGISTSRMHAYGPMGLRELTTTKFVVLGEGQIRE